MCGCGFGVRGVVGQEPFLRRARCLPMKVCRCHTGGPLLLDSQSYSFLQPPDVLTGINPFLQIHVGQPCSAHGFSTHPGNNFHCLPWGLRDSLESSSLSVSNYVPRFPDNCPLRRARVMAKTVDKKQLKAF